MKPSPAAFDVASVKPNTSGQRGMSLKPSPGMLVVNNYTLKALVIAAYRVQDFQVSGGPDWVDDARYDIVGKAGTKANGREMLPMLQAVLADRFSLALHRETRELSGFWLVAAKKGSRLQRPTEGDTSHSGVDIANGQLVGYKLSMERLAVNLGAQLHVPLADKIGLTGEFNFTLEWEPGDIRASGDNANDANVPDKASLFAAIQEQLGLKLELHRVPVEVIVIDHAESLKEQ